jgi:hypothetical protein
MEAEDGTEFSFSLKIPSTEHQAPENILTPSTKTAARIVWICWLGVFFDVGRWYLKI